MPGSLDALQLVATSIVESQSRPRDQVLDSLRGEDLRRLSESGDAGGEVHGDPGGLFACRADLAGVDAGANLDSQRPDSLHDRLRAFHAPCRPVERSEKTIAGDIL